MTALPYGASLLTEGELDRLTVFTPAEEAGYQRQTEVLTAVLYGSSDVLSSYTNHSIPHVREVMEQADLLLGTLQPWVAAVSGTRDLAQCYRLLLIAAKLHDIGMAGTQGMQRLLACVDRCYGLANDRGGAALADCRRELAALADAERFASPHLNLVLNTPEGLLDRSDIAACHDDVQQSIRLRHAETSGRAILKHRAELAKIYGAAWDWAAVALLATLHSDSSQDALAASIPEGRVSKAYCRAFLQAYASPEDAARLDDSALDLVMALAAILRLADTRRSGDRLTTIAGDRLLANCENGRLALRRICGGVPVPIGHHVSHEIICGEITTRFGGVSMAQLPGGTWRMTHDLWLDHADLPEVRSAFMRYRLRSYGSELLSAWLAPAPQGCGWTMSHCIRVHACGADEAWQREAADAMSRMLFAQGCAPSAFDLQFVDEKG